MSERGDIGAHLEAWSAGNADAAHIGRAIAMLAPAHRVMLTATYRDHAPPEAVCRLLAIPARPASGFVEAFRAAQEAVEATVLSLKHDLEYDQLAA